ncbi:LOB domain-containing protein 41-like [Musa acuminata AAA Group]|uniref:LOB domain-containing protein 41-like n=1 Tax=Musa acuminata AAA Group TaxID=214697 RepID=UPI0031D68251
MRKSCNGCRILRKGCSDGCTIRPCLQWIKNPEAQANATAFLAKFYGRAGLVNLINAGTEHLRPAIFRSLLFEACGRIVNPVYGSVGLLWSGSWQLCQAAVEAVLKGAPIIQISSDSAAGAIPALKAHDIRHVSKNLSAGVVPGDLHEVAPKSRTRFKRSAGSPAALVVSKPGLFRRAASHETEEEASREDGSAFSAEGSHVILGEPEGVRLDLRLGMEPENRTGERGAEAKVRGASPSDARPVGPGLSLAA